MQSATSVVTGRAGGVCLVLLLAGFALGGCSSKPTLMPTPTVYTHPDFDPFANVPAELRSNRVEVLYVTDRVPDQDKDAKQSPDHANYGTGRSRSAAFGVAEVQIGKD